jgi:hypothetical protein
MMRRLLGAAAVAAALAFAGMTSMTPAAAAQGTKPSSTAAVKIGSPATATDISAQRRRHVHRYHHRRHYGYAPRYRYYQPHYGYYRPRPHYYRPYGYYGPRPLGFGFGFGPRYW